MNVKEDTMDAYCFFEEELLSSLHKNFVSRFSLEQGAAAELALEIMEMFKMSDSNLYELQQIYLPS